MKFPPVGGVWSRLVLVVATTLACFSGQSASAASTHSRLTAQSVLSIFQPVLAALEHSRVPVFLPTWLPPRVLRPPVGPFLSQANAEGYYVGLSNYRSGTGWDGCNACTVFFISGQRGWSAPRSGQGQRVRTVPLDAQRNGYLVTVNGSIGQYFEWEISGNTYEMRAPVAVAGYVRVARWVARAGSSTADEPWPLRRLLTQFGELRPGYGRKSPGISCPALNRCEADYESTARIITQGAEHVARLIVEDIRRFPTQGAAHSAYARTAGTAGSTVHMPQVGEESEATRPAYEHGADWHGYSILFRRGTYVVSVTFFSTPLNRQAVLTLARSIDRKIVLHG